MESTKPCPIITSARKNGIAGPPQRPTFRQERPFLRMPALVFGYLFPFARRTITQALVALGTTDHDRSAFYRLFDEPSLDSKVHDRQPILLRSHAGGEPRTIHGPRS